jgi:hypothetical protein
MKNLFARQIAKATKPCGAVDIDLLGELVSGAYDQADHDRQRTDRSIALMIEELDHLNRGLERVVEEPAVRRRAQQHVAGAADVRCLGAADDQQPPL